MRRTLDYARPGTDDEPALASHHAALPGWVFQVNAIAAALSWSAFFAATTHSLLGAIILFIAGYAILFAHACFLLLPSLGAIILTERISPWERLAAAAVALVAFAGTFLCVVGLLHFGFCC